MRRRNRTRWKKSKRASIKSEKCITKWCRNTRAKNSNGYLLQHCWKCRSRKLKENRPATYVLNMLRHSARKRNLAFTLTLSEFKQFCRDTGYLERRGTKPTDLTIDRIDWNEGYHLWNLRVLTHEENSRQGADNKPREERSDTDYDTCEYSAHENEPF